MPRIVFSPRALANLEQLFEFAALDNPARALKAINRIRSAIKILESHPEIGRPVSTHIRELVVSHGHTGYLVLYRHLAAQALVRVLAVRHQRQLRYPRSR